MDFLRLLRLPGVFTALADILAGFFIIKLSGLDFERVGTLPYMLGASACLYLGGMVWNDLFDVDEDALMRPSRPLPSGRLRMTTAFITGIILSTAGVLLAMAGGLPAFFTAAGLLLLIFLYNGVLKKLAFFGPLAMGGCRGLNLFLGMCAHPYILYLTDDPRVYLPMIFLTAYTTVLTVISSFEDDGDRKFEMMVEDPDQEIPTELEPLPVGTVPPGDPHEGMRLAEQRRRRELELLLSQNRVKLHVVQHKSVPKTVGGTGGAAELSADAETEGAIPVLSTDTGIAPPPSSEPATDPFLLCFGAVTLLAVPLGAAIVMAGHWLGLALFGLLMLYLLPPVVRAIKQRTGVSVKRVVGAGITGICLLDAGFVASVAQDPLGTENLLLCALIAGLMLPAMVLRRYISVT